LRAKFAVRERVWGVPLLWPRRHEVSTIVRLVYAASVLVSVVVVRRDGCVLGSLGRSLDDAATYGRPR
jgi:uncharacterized membrane protein